MRVLVIEDDAKLAGFVAAGLRQTGHAVDVAATGTDGLEHLTSTAYDAAVVDVMLPGLNGLAVVETARGRKVATPVLILSARRTVDDRVRGLQAGGDDYLTKPFAIAELVARVQALIRRGTRIAEPTNLSAGDLTLDLLARRATRGGQTIELQSKEFALLEYLLRNAGRPVTKAMILEHVWDYHFDPQTNVVDVLVSRVRGKVDREFPAKLIQTIRGVGYVLQA